MQSKGFDLKHCVPNSAFCNNTHFWFSAVFLFLYIAGFVHFQLDLLIVNGNNVFCL